MEKVESDTKRFYFNGMKDKFDSVFLSLYRIIVRKLKGGRK